MVVIFQVKVAQKALQIDTEGLSKLPASIRTNVYLKITVYLRGAKCKQDSAQLNLAPSDDRFCLQIYLLLKFLPTQRCGTLTLRPMFCSFILGRYMPLTYYAPPYFNSLFNNTLSKYLPFAPVIGSLLNYQQRQESLKLS